MVNTDIGIPDLFGLDKNPLINYFDSMIKIHLLIAIETENPARTRYYINVESEREDYQGSTTELIEQKFQKTALTTYDPNDTSIICIHVKSLKRFTLRTKRSKYHFVGIHYSHNA